MVYTYVSVIHSLTTDKCIRSDSVAKKVVIQTEIEFGNSSGKLVLAHFLKTFSSKNFERGASLLIMCDSIPIPMVRTWIVKKKTHDTVGHALSPF